MVYLHTLTINLSRMYGKYTIHGAQPALSLLPFFVLPRIFLRVPHLKDFFMMGDVDVVFRFFTR